MGETAKAHHAARIYSTLSDGASAARSAVAASWSRSVTQYGLDPDQHRPPHRLDSAAFNQAFARTERLVRLAQPTLDRLFEAVGDAGCCVLLTDRDGVPLDRRGAAGDDADFLDLGLWTGMVWSEASEGTNGVGTCLAEGRALTIHRDQHFLTRNIGLSCTVSPIWDAEGRLVATLDVSTCRADLTPTMLRLIATAANEAAHGIEARHFRETFSHARVMLGPDLGKGAAGLIAVDREDLVIGANRAARLAYGLTDARLGSPFPAADLFEGPDGPGEDLITAERGAVQRALSRAKGNVSAAARLLGVSRATMHRKIARFGLGRSH
ncbi:GAF domain-containing protein [Chelatococcus asaccharovorans]|uniref:Regulatory Fis family protein n=1 Tax=Chelatococcus asaccharovorans TaxID=28210 RepID=A0A2V3UGK7_9HYPH|nr:GAF domain-containing protein [Chelatococcus asaccharovorans]MBS7701798.1 sigma-54-dependent Fis family transcriptional regulator [Chelatococcus asaccharovorans]PXW64495.1 regulatory Fis family protein [Chelatococcus asaccharovorans]